MAEDENVSQRECEMQHEALTARLDKIDDNISKMFEKLDALTSIKGKAEFTDQKVDTLGKKFDKHVDNHASFITWSLAILALAGTLISVITFIISKKP